MEDITIIKNFLDNTNHYYQPIDELAVWHNELTVMATGINKKINRSMCYVSDKEEIYKYAGLEFPGTTWKSFDREVYMGEYENTLLFILNKLNDIGFEFNSVLINKYKDGRDEIKWHSDKEDTLGENPVIACVNLGATRKFWFMNLETKEKFYHELADGDLLIMGPECQKKYLHAILKEKEVTESRISLTFRKNYHDDTTGE